MLAWPWLDFDSVLRHTTGTRYEFDLIVVYSLVRITQWVWGLKPLGARSSEAPKGEKGRKKRNSNRQKPLSAENLPLLVAATGKCWRNIDVINFERFFFKYALEIVKFKALPAAISPNIKEWFWKGWDIIRYFIFVPSSRPGFILHLGDSLKSEFWLPSKFSEFQNSVVCALCERSNLIAHQRSQLCLVNSWLKLYQDV